jgi:hypothetical protein
MSWTPRTQADTTLRLDEIKLVTVDLDDTLWRGVAAQGTLGILEG